MIAAASRVGPALRIGVPPAILSRHWRSLFAIDRIEASFCRRGFEAADATVRLRLERIGETFLDGFNRGLVGDDLDTLWQDVGAVCPAVRGFAIEGATMGVALADALVPIRPRLGAWMVRADESYTYLAHVGTGWALARAPWRRAAVMRHADPVHCWLVFDGLGFHDAYFHPQAVRRGWRRRRSGYAARVYDQGVGRALWFVSGGDVARAIAMVSSAAPDRQGDLWSGFGLALTYAGGADAAALAAVRSAAGRWRRHLAQGAAFAAEAHARAGAMPTHVAVVLPNLAGCDATAAVAIVRGARAALPPFETAQTPRYELWRQAVQRELST